MPPMLLEIITAERQVYSDEVDLVVAPGVVGELGILPHHAPLMTVLQPGELLVRKDNEDTYMVVTGGFLEVLGNKVTILADAAERSEEIDEARAQAAVERAQAQIHNRESNAQLEEALRSLRRAQVRVVVSRRRRPGGAPRGMDQPPGAAP